MKYSTKVSDAVHMLVYIYLGAALEQTSDAIATSIHTNPGVVRQNMMKLKQAGIINSVRGHAMPTLAKTPEQITLLDVYRAMEGEKPLLHLDTHVNPECGVGMNIQYALKDYYDSVQSAAEKEMQSITLADIIDSFHRRIKK